MRINRIRLITVMAEHDIRQYALADKIGMSRATVNGVCRGLSCKEETARKIADALGVELESILEN